MEQRLKELEARLADLEQEGREIGSALERQKEIRADLAQKMADEMKELLGRLETIERELETLEGQ